MGFLAESEPLTWEESLHALHYIRDHGIEQFLHTYHSVKGVKDDLLRWGDEIEYALVKLTGHADDRKAVVSLRGPEAISDLKRLEEHGLAHGLSDADRCSWMPEYGAWMLEGTPGKPFEGVTSLVKVEDNMSLRRSRLLAVLHPGEIVPTMACFPMLGVHVFTSPEHPPCGPVAQSIFIPDEAIFPHARFRTLTANIRKRRGSKVCIERPKFKDTATLASEFPSDGVPASVEDADSMPHVYADAMAFGMGSCCLQVTFQAKTMAESRHLYDHLAVMTPIMMALTAASPILRGWLLDEDCRKAFLSRWDIVSQSVDDRTPAERGEDPRGRQRPDSRLAGHAVKPIQKSRYGGIDCYLCNCKDGVSPTLRASTYNDIPMALEEEHERRLITAGVDRVLARHVAHLFGRDPLVVFRDRIEEIDDRVDMDHWESLQSTNWQSVRWKPPHPSKGTKESASEDHVGWRVEFRTMEIQLTDFENAAFVAFIVLLSRVILGLELNLYIPISKLDENMRRAHAREAATQQKFWFRRDLIPTDVSADMKARGCTANESSPARRAGQNGFSADNARFDNIELMTAEEILCGKGGYFPGLVPLCKTYLDFIGCDSVTRDKLNTYLDFIIDRSTGKCMTAASWIRKFVRSHPDYKQDSRVPQTTAYDLVKACHEIGIGQRGCPDILGDNKVHVVSPATNPFSFVHEPVVDVADEIASTARTACQGTKTETWVGGNCRAKLLAAYVHRAVKKKREGCEKVVTEHEAAIQRLQAELDAHKAGLEVLRESELKLADASLTSRTGSLSALSAT